MSTEARRVVPLPDSAWKELMLWKKAPRWSQQRAAGDEWQDLGFVFTVSKGTPFHSARRSFERVCAKAELGEWGPEPKREHPVGPLPAREFTPAFRIYDLRHTYATLMVLNGVPVMSSLICWVMRRSRSPWPGTAMRSRNKRGRPPKSWRRCCSRRRELRDSKRESC